MRKWIMYDPNHEPMMFPSGALADREGFLRDFPAIEMFPHVILTDDTEQMCWAVENLAAAKSRMNLETATDEELLSAMTAEENTEPNAVPVQDIASPSERIAAALEFQNLLALEDVK